MAGGGVLLFDGDIIRESNEFGSINDTKSVRLIVAEFVGCFLGVYSLR